MSPPAVARPPGSPPHPFAVQCSSVFIQQEGFPDLRQGGEELQEAENDFLGQGCRQPGSLVGLAARVMEEVIILQQPVLSDLEGEQALATVLDVGLEDEEELEDGHQDLERNLDFALERLLVQERLIQVNDAEHGTSEAGLAGAGGQEEGEGGHAASLLID